MPDKLQIQIETLQQSGKKWCYTNFELMNEKRETIPSKAGFFQPLSGNIIEKVLTAEAAIIISSVMVDRNLFQEVGCFQEDALLIFREDYDLHLRLALSEEVIAVPDVLVKVREHAGRITNSLPDPHERSAIPYLFFIDLKPGKKLKKIARQRHAHHMAMAAKNNLSHKKYLRAFGQLRKALTEGDNLRHILSCLYYGFTKSFVKK
jgi:GT2 family glycosyltransferase